MPLIFVNIKYKSLICFDFVTVGQLRHAKFQFHIQHLSRCSEFFIYLFIFTNIHFQVSHLEERAGGVQYYTEVLY